MAVTANTLALIASLRARLGTRTDEQVRTMTAAWARAWDEVATDLDTALGELTTSLRDGRRITRAQMIRSRRLTAALGHIAEQLDEVAGRARVTITTDLPDVVDDAGRVQDRVVASQLPLDMRAQIDGWSRVDPAAIDAIATRSTQQITSTLRPVSRETMRVIRRELVRGVAAGSNPRQVAAQMVARTEKRFNGVLTRALTIARTEMLDAHRAGAALGQAQHADTLAGWVWTATLDRRTCPACWGQHGQLHPLDEAGPLGHQNCRCARTPKTKTWRELGIDMAEPVDLTPSSADRFAQLGADGQLEVLGRGRYEAWRAGEYPMDAWSVSRSTPGWRDSVHTSPVPQVSGGRERSSAALAS